MALMEITDVIRGYQRHLEAFEASIGQDGMAQQAYELQQRFQSTLWQQLTTVELGQQQSQWNAATTELHRDMRLLSVEVNFAKAASQADKRQQRLNQLRGRTHRLQEFAQVLLVLIAGDKDE